MAKRTVEESSLIAVADSIRAKAGKSDKLEFPSGFKSAIDSISNSEIKNQDITIKENGTFTPDDGYTGFGTVKVETEVAKNQDITITENGTYTPPSGYTGFGTVTVDAVKNQNITIKENGTYTPDSGFTGFGSVTVEVEGSLPPGVGIYYIGTARSNFGSNFTSSAIGTLE